MDDLASGSPQPGRSSIWESVLQRSLESGDSDRIAAALQLAEQGGADGQVLATARRRLRSLEEDALAVLLQKDVDATVLVAAIERAEDAGVRSSILQKARAMLRQLAFRDLRQAVSQARASGAFALAACESAEYSRRADAVTAATAAGHSAEAQAKSLEAVLRRTSISDKASEPSEKELFVEARQELRRLRAAAASAFNAEARMSHRERSHSGSSPRELVEVCVDVASPKSEWAEGSNSPIARPSRHQSPARVAPQVLGHVREDTVKYHTHQATAEDSRGGECSVQ